MSDWVWVLIPLVAMMIPLAKQWIRMKEQTALLGNSARDLQSEVESLSMKMESMASERKRLVRRIEHLETIVTDETWDVLGDDPELAAAQKGHILPEEATLDPTTENEERVSHIARKLRH